MPVTSTRISRKSRRLGAGVAGLLVLGVVPFAVGAAHADEAFELRRIAGDTRFETAALIRDEFGPSSRVILANGERGMFADALVASYLAGATESPILLTKSGRMPAATRTAIQASGADKITIVGGTGSVSAGQQTALTEAGYTVDRIAGPNRYATNAAVLEAVGQPTSTTALVTTGVDFPDALAASAVSYRTGMPLALTGRHGTNELVIKALRAAGVREFVVLGGDGAVSPEAVADLQDAGMAMTARLAGADRARTSVLLADYAVTELGFTNAGVNVASGYVRGSGADALAGGPLSGKQIRPLLITRSQGTPGDTVLAYLQQHAATLTEGLLFGGEGAVEAGSAARMISAARTPAPPPPPPPSDGGGGGGGGETPPPPPPPPSATDPASVELTSTTDGQQRLDLAESHNVTAHVLDGAGNPVTGATVTFAVTMEQNATGGSGTVPPAEEMTTDASGNATYSYLLAPDTGGYGCFPAPPEGTTCTSERIDAIQVSTANGLNASMAKSWWGNGVENPASGRIYEGVNGAENQAASGDTLLVFGTGAAGGFTLDGGEGRCDGTTTCARLVEDLTVDGTATVLTRGTGQVGRDAKGLTGLPGVTGATITGFDFEVSHDSGRDTGLVVINGRGVTITGNTFTGGADGLSNEETGIRTEVEVPDNIAQATISANEFTRLFTAVQACPGAVFTINGGNTFTANARGVGVMPAARTDVCNPPSNAGDTIAPPSVSVSGNTFDSNNPYHVSDYTKSTDLSAMLEPANTFVPANPVIVTEVDAAHIVDPGADPGTEPPPPNDQPGLALTPGSADLRSGQTHVITATVLDDASKPVAGTPVTFTVTTTAGTPPAPETVTTDASGTATFDYTVPDGTADRTDSITAATGTVSADATANWFDSGVQIMRTGRIRPTVQGAENRAQNGDRLEVFGNAAQAGFFVDSGENLDADLVCHEPVTDLTIDGSDADDVHGTIRLGHPAVVDCGGRVMNASIGVTIQGFDVFPSSDKPAFEVVNATGFHLVGNDVVGGGGGLGVANWAGSAGAFADGEISGGNTFQGLTTGILFNAAGSRESAFTVTGNTFTSNARHATDPLGRSSLDAMLASNTFQPDGAVVQQEGEVWHIVNATVPST